MPWWDFLRPVGRFGQDVYRQTRRGLDTLNPGGYDPHADEEQRLAQALPPAYDGSPNPAARMIKRKVEAIAHVRTHDCIGTRQRRHEPDAPSRQKQQERQSVGHRPACQQQSRHDRQHENQIAA